MPPWPKRKTTQKSLRDADRKEMLGRQLYRWFYPKPIIGAVSGWCLGAASWLPQSAAAGNEALSWSSASRASHPKRSRLISIYRRRDSR
jgi:hypothetical protein